MSFILIMGYTPERTPLLLPFDPRPYNAYDHSQTEIPSLIKDKLSPSSPVDICKRRYLLRSNRPQALSLSVT
jgi:hypothetical protein